MSGGLASWLSILAVVLISGIQAAPASAAQCSLTPGAVVQLVGTPHLFIADGQRVLHWGGDTRALAGQSIDWSNICSVDLNELRAMQRGDPWLSSGLPKIGEPIYLSKWEDSDAAPTLLHIQSIADVELFGINERNYGNFVLDRPVWEQRYGFRVGDLQVGPLASASSFAWPSQDQASYGRLLDTMKGVLGAQLFRGVQAGIDPGLLLPGIAQCERAGLNDFERGRNPASAMGATQDCLARLNVGGPPGPPPGPGLGMPFPPTNVQVIPLSSTQVRVDWDGVPNAAGYRIFGGDPNTPANTFVTAAPAGSTVQDISGRAPGTVYCYSVSSFNPVGESPLSTSVCAQTPASGTAGLNPPTNLTISQIAIGQGVSGLRLSWTDTSTSETGFQIVRGDQQLATIGAGSTSYSDMTWTSDLSSCYKVVAVNDVGTATSDQACLTLSGAGDVPPSAPTNLHAVLVPGVAGVQLTWTDTSTTETGFQVVRDDQPVTTLGPNSTSYTDPSWNPQSPSCYKVLAFNAFGPTASDRVCPGAANNNQPSAPTNLVVSVLQGGRAIRLTWADGSTNEDGFQILRNNLMIASTGPNVGAYTDIAPDQGANCYRIAAYNGTGAGYSSQVCR